MANNNPPWGSKNPLAIFDLPPEAKRSEDVMNEGASLIGQLFGERLTKKTQEAQLKELQLNIERDGIFRIEREEIARLSARAKWEASQQAALSLTPATPPVQSPPPAVAQAPTAPAPEEKPLGTRERNTLLAIIAALCKEAKIDYTKPAKAAGQILHTTDSMGLQIGETTIERHLKKIPDALGARMK